MKAMKPPQSAKRKAKVKACFHILGVDFLDDLLLAFFFGLSERDRLRVRGVTGLLRLFLAGEGTSVILVGVCSHANTGGEACCRRGDVRAGSPWVKDRRRFGLPGELTGVFERVLPFMRALIRSSKDDIVGLRLCLDSV